LRWGNRRVGVIFSVDLPENGPGSRIGWQIDELSGSSSIVESFAETLKRDYSEPSLLAIGGLAFLVTFGLRRLGLDPSRRFRYWLFAEIRSVPAKVSAEPPMPLVRCRRLCGLKWDIASKE